MGPTALRGQEKLLGGQVVGDVPGAVGIQEDDVVGLLAPLDEAPAVLDVDVHRAVLAETEVLLGHLDHVRIDIHHVDRQPRIVLAEQAGERAAAQSHDQHPLGLLDHRHRDEHRLNVLEFDVVGIAHLDDALGAGIVAESQVPQTLLVLADYQGCVGRGLLIERLLFGRDPAAGDDDGQERREQTQFAIIHF